MLRIVSISTMLLAFALGFACATREPAPPAPEGPVGATLLSGLGSYRAAFSPKDAAEPWFDQGLRLAYGFNHDAAERSFLKGAELDPACAMCWWGAALVLGPHLNAPMDPANNAKAWHRVQKAQELAAGADKRERALIAALAARYAAEPPKDRAGLDADYAKAMKKVRDEFPRDPDVATLYAEALMDLQPWDYYDNDQDPKGKTEEFVETLEAVLRRSPHHPGALHLYIHAVEASAKPERGVAAADRLRDLMPGAGHLVHMPAHIYTRVGRYHDAVLANRKAIEADNAYLAACRPALGVYPLGYVPHNHHFLWWAASMMGDAKAALAAADETARRAWIPEAIAAEGNEFLQDFWVTPIKARVQFARWTEIAAIPKPPSELHYAVAIWHFGQGMAAAAEGRKKDARKHLDQLERAARDERFEKYFVGPQHSLSRTLRVAERVLAAEVAAAHKEHRAALNALEEAVDLEDDNPYFEPPLWHQPTRYLLGAMLLRLDEPARAERAFREDLSRNHNNAWSMQGLAESRRRQVKSQESAQLPPHSG